MLISVEELVRAWSIKPSGVIHIGAHAAEESLGYMRFGWGPVIWVEANPQLIERIRESIPDEDLVLCAALWDESGQLIDLNVASNGQSSSLLRPALHLKEYPEILFNSQIKVHSQRLDSILTQIPNFLNIDVQGAELHVLRGLGQLIDSLDYIYTEVNDKELYVGCVKLSDLEKFLKINGFRRVCLRRCGKSGWGDALYVRKTIEAPLSLRITARTFVFYLKLQIGELIRLLKNRP